MPGCSGIGECRCCCHDFKLTQNIIELLCPCLTIKLILCQEHCHTHKELLRKFYRYTITVFKQISVVECSNTKISELQIPFRLDIVIQFIKVILLFESKYDTPFFLSTFKVITKVIVSCKACYLMINVIQEESGSYKGPVRPVDIDLVNSCLNKCYLYLFGADHVTKLELCIDF